ncbi:PPC domain-containing DNA-binding protein [Halomonas huangheensis]|uniref:PPC domain-containing protein n=1 Tax=Halomonas huangheensis TaxID=1178482 RepID=W1NCP7_9GAMM|nr:hypothetical protein [Halomonas huangheensis]ALM50919.1 DNA-binding protein [Halomonas huangheensis]ERL53317.1 hypothetical protein BJB45_21000 [Halomonas huangheensis]
MKRTFANPWPRPRMLRHAGHFNPLRIHSMHYQGGRHIRLLLTPGKSLFDALVEPLREAGVTSASMTILGGRFAHLEYCVAPPDPSGQAAIAYSRPIDAGEAFMVFGNATLGKDMQQRPLVHCHATLRTCSNEVKGGHIVPQASIIGEQPIPVLVTAIEGFELRQAFDDETNIALLKPYKES